MDVVEVLYTSKAKTLILFWLKLCDHSSALIWIISRAVYLAHCDELFTVHFQHFAAILCQLIEMDTACVSSCHWLHFIFALNIFHTWGIERSLQYFLMPLELMHVRRVITIHVNFEICDFNSDPCVTSSHLVCNVWLYRTVLYKGWQNWSNLLDAWPHIVHDRYIVVFILYGSCTLYN